MPKSIKPNVPVEELVKYWVRTIRKAIANGDYATVCWCADVREKANDDTTIPAILIHAEHVNSFSEDLLIAYRKDAGKIVFGEPKTQPTPHQIFQVPT